MVTTLRGGITGATRIARPADAGVTNPVRHPHESLVTSAPVAHERHMDAEELVHVAHPPDTG